MRSSTGGVSGALQGKIPGVAVSNSSGDPTGGPGIVIRGQGSPNGESVLWVVDGVPGAPMPQNDNIASIVVLKDAASASIYGAQAGAGGVILVTTKKAKLGAPSISYDGTFGVRNAAKLVKPLNAEQELQMRQISYKNAGMTVPDAWNPDKNPWIKQTRTNWMDEIFRTAFYQRHNVALNVGTENFQNRISFAFDYNKGLLISTYKKAYNVHYNGSFKLNNWVTISEDLNWRNDENRSRSTYNEGYTGPILSAIYMPASATVYNPLDGTYGGTTTEDPEYIAQHGTNYGEAHGDVANPVRLLCADSRRYRWSQVWSTTSLQIANILPGLKFNSRFSYVNSHYNYKSFNPIRDEIGKPEMTNTEYLESSRADAWKTENTLTYDNTFGKHTVGALISTTADKSTGFGMNMNGKDFSSESPNLQYISFASSVSQDEWLNTPDSNVSLIGRLAYSFDDRYFVTASFRRDYAGRLPKNKNFGDFPAVTAAWKISNEKFFPKNTAINLLKIRGSWGRIGNLGSIYTGYASPSLTKKNWNEGAQYGSDLGNVWGVFFFNSSAVNQDLTWETSEQYDLGLDVAAFDNRLSASFDYYNKRTYNLIQSQTMNWPATIGLSKPLVNLGEIRNTGFEVQVNWSDKINKDWSYFVNANFAYNKNKVTDIGVKNADGTPGTWTDGKTFRSTPYMIRTCEGGPLNQYYLIKTDGIFQSDEEANNYLNKEGKKIQPQAQAGDLKFVDYNGDGKIDDGDRQYMGSSMPKTTFAFNLGFTWKNLSFSAMLQGVGGAQTVYVGKQMILSDQEGSFNRAVDILNAWSPENRDTNIPRLAKTDNNSNMTTPSDWYLENTSYLRLKNVTIGYDLTSLVRKWQHLNSRSSRLSVFFSGENLATITNYSGMDPECGDWDGLRYPVARTFSFGVKLTY